MPREVILNHGIVGLAQHGIQTRQPDRGGVVSPSDDLAGVLPSRLPNAGHSKTTTQELNNVALRGARGPVIEIIELSSDSDDNVSPSKFRHVPPQSRHFVKPPNPARPLSKQTGPKKQVPEEKKHVYVISSSSEDEDLPIRGGLNPSNVTLAKNKAHEERLVPSAARLLGPGLQVHDNGIIEYTPTPRKPFHLSPSKATKKKKMEISLESNRPGERRRTLLEPDVEGPPKEDLSWELEQDESGGIRSGAMLVFPPDVLHCETPIKYPSLQDSPPLGSQETALPTFTETSSLVPQTPSSPQKTPRRKRMPEPVALLHRIAVPYLKELDAKVFGNQLGASYLPDLDPLSASPTKGRGRNHAAAIWGMGSKGDFNDGNGSFIELIWSNRMATTAGRTEYKKSSERQISIKIELGVKVVTSEERLRNTLAHEACHAATWAISGDFERPHGATFKKWASKVMKAFPGVEVTTKHDYEIEFKFTWKCVNVVCGQIYKRHSNSINIEEHGCHCGSRLQPQFTLPNRAPRKATTPQAKAAALGNGLARASPASLPFLDLMEDGNGISGRQISVILDDIVDLGSESEEVSLADNSAVDALAFKLQATTM